MSDLYDYCNNPELWKKSGMRIKKRRKELNIKSMDKFGEMISESSPIDRRLIGQIEAGKISINKINTLAAFCRVLQCDPEYITCQCDTLRKENADPVKRFWLSENTLNILSADTVNRNYDSGSEHSCSYAFVINFLFEHIDLIEAIDRLIEISLYPHENTETVTYKVPGGKLTKIDNFMKGPIIGAYIVNNDHARFIVEQQLIEKFRKAIAKTNKEINDLVDMAVEKAPL